MSTPQIELRRERRMPVRTIGAVSASVLAFPLLASTAEAATIPFPKPSRTLPAALDVAAFYQEGTRCLTQNQPGRRRVRQAAQRDLRDPRLRHPAQVRRRAR